MATVIYYVPHQDDEIVTFGVSVVRHVIEGHDVHLVFYTDGSSSAVIHYFNGNEPCPLHSEAHDFQFTEKKLTEVRNREMIWSSLCLGVNPSHLHWHQEVKDGQFTIENGIELIDQFEANYPNAYHMVISYKDPHPDHANMGKALKTMLEDKKVSNGKFYLKTSQLDEFNGTDEPCKDTYLPFLHAAQQAYKVYQPENGFYAVGYHSVPSTFDSQYKNPRSKYHLLNE